MVEFNNKNKLNRIKGFYLRYLELCRLKNRPRLADIKKNIDNNNLLEFFGDRFNIDDWLLILESLYYDQTLQNIAICLRKNWNIVLENINSEKKARLYKEKPVIFTNYIFNGLVEALTNCIKNNNNLQIIALEGLPLLEKYIVFITRALSENKTVQDLSFARSSLGDKGCELVCSIVKHLPNIEKLNMSRCDISTIGAESISDLIKFQKIYRYSEGWKNSLRYRDVDVESISGLKKILLNHNPNIGDRGLEKMAEILKEDAWIKVIEMEDCGLTDIGMKFLIDALQLNQSLTIFTIRNNPNISNEVARAVRMHLSHENSDEINQDEPVKAEQGKSNIMKLSERIKLLEEQYESELFRRKQMEDLNDHLHKKIIEYEELLKGKQEIPEGYTMVEEKSLEALIKDRDDLKKSLSNVRLSRLKFTRKLKLKKARSETPGKSLNKMREKSSRSEHGIFKSDQKETSNKIVIEKGIGDTGCTEYSRSYEASEINNSKPASNNSMRNGMNILQVFMKKKSTGDN